MAETILTVAALFVAALALIFLEVFIPSFGLITLVAAVLYGMALWVGYHADPLIMKTTLWLTVPALPLTLWLAFKLLPHSPLVLKSRPGNRPTEADALRVLIGREGKVASDLRPVGKVEVDGARYEAVSRHGMMERGEPVRVIGVESERLIVTAASGS